MGISDFYSDIYNGTPARSDGIHSAIFDNPDLEVLTPSGDRRRFPHRIPLEDTLCLKKQRSFHLPNAPGTGTRSGPASSQDGRMMAV